MRILASAFSFAILLTSCSGHKQPEASAPPPIPIRIAKISQIQEQETVAVSGSVVAPGNPAELAFLVSGKVIQAGPREGDFVKKGQVLAVIDPADYQFGVSAAVAQSAAAKAVLAKADAPARPEQLEQAKIAYERAENEYQRMKMLFDSKSLAPNDFQKFQAAYEASRQQYEMAKMGAQKEDKAQARATADQADVAERVARKRLADATLYAPIDGFITRRSVEPGDTAAPGKPVYEIVRLDPVEINVGIPETDIRLVRVGQKAIVRIPALPDQEFQGIVRVINVSADPSTRTYMARIVVPNPKRVLRIGMIAEARIQGNQKRDVMTIPGESIVRDPQGATIVFVYFPDQKRVYSKRVETGTVFGKEVQIRSGLTGSESIVIAGQNRLRDGNTVNATEGRP